MYFVFVHRRRHWPSETRDVRTIITYKFVFERIVFGIGTDQKEALDFYVD